MLGCEVRWYMVAPSPVCVFGFGGLGLNRMFFDDRMKYLMLNIRKIAPALVLGLMMLSSVGRCHGIAQPAGDNDDVIRYTVDCSDVKNHYLSINVTVPVTGKTTELMMAVWTPGSYLVREYTRHIDSLDVTANGRKLAFGKTRKNRWLVQTDGIKSFKVKYRLYCNEMSVRTNWVGKQFALINGAPSYLTVPDRLNRPHIVQLTMPRGWTRSATSLRATGDTPHTFIAEDFDELVDSPIVAGNVNVYPFTVGGVEHQLVNVGESGYWDGTKATTDLKKVVQSHHDMWGVVPYDRYLFLNMIVESGGGLEHDNSNVLMTSRWTFRDPNRYKSWLSLASHEFFHAWNVRRLRPKPLIKYDYENEVYTDSLWIAEGITSYYEDLALVRSGLMTRSEFLSQLSRNVEGVQRTGGRKLQSLKDSSFDAWIKFYRPDENSSNTQISYYSKGAVVAFLLDAKIRKLTQGEKSLDDVLRKMFSEFVETGFTAEDFRQTSSDVAGQDLTDWFASTIDSTEELDYSDIEAIGVEVPNKQVDPKPEGDLRENAPETAADSADKSNKKSDSGKKAAPSEGSAEEEGSADPGDSQEAVSAPTSGRGGRSGGRPGSGSSFRGAARAAGEPTPWLGFSSSSSDGRVTVSSVKPDSPASDVGLNNGDEIIAVDGFRITGSVDSRMPQYKVGDEIEILISRRGQLLTLPLTIGELKSESWRLRFSSKLSEEQKQQLDRWLGTEKK